MLAPAATASTNVRSSLPISMVLLVAPVPWLSYEVGHLGAHWQLVRFLPVQAGSSALQTFGVWALTEHAHLEYLGSKTIVAIAVCLVWNYPMNRYFVFRQWTKAEAPRNG